MIPVAVTYQLESAKKLLEAREAIVKACHMIKQIDSVKSRLKPIQHAQLDEMVAQLDVCVVSLVAPDLLTWTEVDKPKRRT